MKKALMIIAIIAIAAIAGSLIYYFVFFRSGIEKAEIKLQEQRLELEKGKQRADEIRIEEDKEYKEQQELNNKAELVEKLDNLDKWYNEALETIIETYHEDWDLNCKKLGLSPRSPLPGDIAKELDDRYQKSIEVLNKRYQDLKDNIYKLYE